MMRITKSLVYCLLLLAAVLSSPLRAATVDVGKRLQQSFVWTRDFPGPQENLHVVFRREFPVESVPEKAQLHLFAYTRYQLFVNGEYVGRGPNRFENRRPEYDSWDIAARLRPGTNLIAVLVHRDWPGVNPKSMGQTLSRFLIHAPGFAASLEMRSRDGRETIIASDESWQAFTETGLAKPVKHSYSSVPDNFDARKSPGDWMSPTFAAPTSQFAQKIPTSDLKEWPVPSPRTIPLLRESKVPFTWSAGDQNATLTNNGEWRLKCQQIVQAYWVLDIEAEPGTKIVVMPVLPEGKHGAPGVYVCRAGRQRWMSGDTFAFNELSIRVESGRAKLLKTDLVEVLYPFERVGSFSSSDPMLDHVWQITARSLELMSEDAYTDCSDRERSEWMDCDPPMYDATRVMQAGPGPNGEKVWSDPRLFKNLLLRVAMTQEPDGMLRARTCSELVDLHTRMEDRACDWVDGLRKYYEATGDKDLIRELWPECEKLLQWFADRRTANGLVKAREWIAWDNPMSYATCEGAGNNAFIQRAFADAAWLAKEIGNQSGASKWNEAAEKLKHDFNRLLWNESAGAYGAAFGTPEILPEDRHFRKAITLKSVDGRAEPTLHANLFALDRGIVPPERRDRVMQWTLKHEGQIRQVMANYYFFKILYGLDRSDCDQKVLDRIRRGWKGMVESPWQTTWESMGGGSKVHCYGIVPGYILSAYVLGVRRDAPVWNKQLIIEPHLGDLKHAEGVVVTEFGPVKVSWKMDDPALKFSLTIPQGAVATLALPLVTGRDKIVLNGKTLRGEIKGSRLIVPLSSGSHSGSY